MQCYRTGPRKQSFSPALNYEVVNYEFIINSLQNRFCLQTFFFLFIGGYMCDLIAVSHPFGRLHVVGSQLYTSCRGF